VLGCALGRGRDAGKRAARFVSSAASLTGKQHAGDFIDLLGDCRVRSRSGDAPLFDLDLT